MPRVKIFLALCFFLSAIAVIGDDADPFKVIEWGPVGEVRDLAQARTIHVTFNRPMAAIELPGESAAGPLEISPPIAGRYRWSGTQTLTFTADTVLPVSTLFSLRVPASTRSLAGDTLGKEFTFRFETPRLRVIGVHAGPNTKDIAPGQEIFVRFSNPVRASRIGQRLHLPVPFSVRMPSREEVERMWSDVAANRVVAITPDPAWPEDSPLTFRIDAGVRGEEGNLGMRDTFSWTGRTAGPLRFLGLGGPDTDRPYDHIFLRFTSRVSVAEVAKHLKLEPAAKISDESKTDFSSATDIYLPVNLKPGTRYTLSLDEGLASIHGKSLGKPAVIEFRTGNLPAQISMLSGHATLDLDDTRALGVFFTNVDTARLRMARVSAEAFLGLEKFTAQIDTIWRVRGETNVRTRWRLPIGDLLPRGTPGFLRISVEDSPSVRELDLQITSLGITGKFSPDSIHVFVTKLRGALPLEGASVTLLFDSRVLWRGKTGPDGIARAPGWNEWNLGNPDEPWVAPTITVIVSHENDKAVLSSDWTEGIEAWRFPIWHEEGGLAREIRGVLFSDRGIYRPGDVVELKGVMRTTTPDGLAAPAARTAAVRITSPSGDEVFFGTALLSPRGGFDLAYRIRPGAPLGYYRVRALPGDTFPAEDWREAGVIGSFRVAEYRPTRIKATVQLPERPVRLGEKVDAVVSGRSLVGTPLAGRKVRVTAEIRTAPPTPLEYPEFSFTPDRKSDYEPDLNGNERARNLLLDRAYVLDQEGVLKVSVTPPYRTGKKVLLTDAALTVEATVEDLSRQTASARATIALQRGRYIVGIKAGDYFVPSSRPASLEVIVLNRDEKPAAGRKVKITVVRRTWINKREQSDGGPIWVSKPVDKVVSSATIRSGTKAVTWRFTPKSAGYYIATAVVTDEKGRAMQAATDLYVYGGNASWWESNDDRLDLIPDRRSYKPGDVARVIIRSPFKRARAWITTEREGIREGRIAVLEGTSPMIEVPLGENDVPNTYVGVVLIDLSTARRESSPVKLGLANLAVEPRGRRIEIKTSSDRGEYRPGDTVTVNIKALTAGGDATVAVVDEGVLSLISYRFPDPIERFFEQRSHHVTTSELRTHLIGSRDLGEKGEDASGDGGDPGSRNQSWMRKNFNPTAAWFPTVALDHSGNASVTFTLPDNLTTYRVLVFVNGDSDCFGTDGSATFMAKRPLVLEPVHPRFVRPGDTFTAGVLVRNLSPASGTVRIGDKTVAMASGTDTVVLWTYVAPLSGRMTFSWRGQLTDDASDAVEVSIPVVPHRADDISAASGSVIGALAEETVRIPSGVDRSVGGVSIDLATTALVHLAGATDYLFQYPYGCLEQRTSAVIPIIELGDAASELGLKTLPDARAAVVSYLDDLYLFRSGDGGFAMWKGQYSSQPFMTALVVKTMIRAKRRGFIIDEKLLQGAIDHLRTLLAENDRREPYSPIEALVADAFVIEALAEAGLVDQGDLERAFETRSRMSVSGVAALYRASILAKAESMRADLRRELLNAIRLSPATAHFEEALPDGRNWLCQSHVTATALALEAFLEDAEPFVHAEKVARWLAMERRNGRWRTTRENASVAAALGSYYRKYESETPNLTATAQLADSVLVSKVFSGRTTDVVRGFVPMWALPAGDILAKFISQGAGRMYYEARLAGRYQSERAVDHGFGVEQTIETLDGKPVRPDQLRASQVYRIRLAVTSLEQRLFVVLDAGLPAGLEPIDLSLETERRQVGGERAAWSSFVRHELRDDRLVYFADRFTAGRHEVSALVRATSAGEFEWPGARAEAMYEPEVYGRTGEAQGVIR